jgi:hypothetical protein
MHGLPVLVRFAGFKRHWLLAQRATNETGCPQPWLRTTLPEASGFQFQGAANFSNDGAEFLRVLFVGGLFAECQPKFFSLGLHVSNLQICKRSLGGSFGEYYIRQAMETDPHQRAGSGYWLAAFFSEAATKF